MTLQALQVGKRATVRFVEGRDALGKRLIDMGMVPGTEITLLRRAPLGDPMQVFLRGYSMMLRREESLRIEVAPF